jgi:hypothetical protein
VSKEIVLEISGCQQRGDCIGDSIVTRSSAAIAADDLVTIEPPIQSMTFPLKSTILEI